jgi:cation:H+ antiporter
LITSALFIVRAVEDISLVLGVSSALIGVLVIAVCTSLPELIVGLRSVRSNKGSITLGDILGSATINSTLVLGTVALI